MRYFLDFTPCPRIILRDTDEGLIPGHREEPVSFFVLPGLSSGELVGMSSLRDALLHVGPYTNVSLLAPDGTTPRSVEEQIRAKPFNKDQMLEYARSILLSYFLDSRCARKTYVMFVSVDDDVFNYPLFAANAELSRRLGLMIDRCLPQYYLEWKSAHEHVWSSHLMPGLYGQLTLGRLIDTLTSYPEQYIIEYGLGAPHVYPHGSNAVAFAVTPDVSVKDMVSRIRQFIGMPFGGTTIPQRVTEDTPCWAVQREGERGEPLTLRHVRTFRISNFDEVGPPTSRG